jgi:hypothetical protein
MVTGSLPVDVSIAGCVARVFTATFSKATPVLFEVNANIVALSFKSKLMELLAKLALSVTAWAVETEDTFAVN